MIDYKTLLQECDDLVKAGESQQVAHKLASLNTARVPRDFRLPLAKICTRSGLTSLGLKLLTVVVREERDVRAPELAEYGLLLQRNGSTQEALATLGRAAAAPEAWFYTALCHFSRWEYGEAIPFLHRYLHTLENPYARAVAEVNLAAAYVATGAWDNALQLLNPGIETARASHNRRLLGNSLELRSQVFIQRGELVRARSDLDGAAALFAQDKTHDQLFVEKWRAFLHARETGRIKALIEFRAHAVSRRHWESVREADLLALRVHFDQSRFEHLMFGTPHAAYRARVAAILTQEIRQPFSVFGEGPCFDVLAGTLENKLIVNPGKKIHQLVDLLTRDLYRPLRLGSLFAELFPGEYFNAFSSPDRVHQIVRRTRRWLDQQKLAIKIVESEGAYSLQTTGPLALKLPFERGQMNKEYVAWLKLTGSTFTAAEARRQLGMPRASFNRLTQWAEKSGLLTRTGSGNKIKYLKAG